MKGKEPLNKTARLQDYKSQKMRKHWMKVIAALEALIWGGVIAQLGQFLS